MAFLLKYLKPILAVLAVVALIGAGVYVRGLVADRAELEQQVEDYKTAVLHLSQQIERERAATEQAQEAARVARVEAGDARKGIENARRTDPAAEAWATQPLPAGIADSLRRKPKAN